MKLKKLFVVSFAVLCLFMVGCGDKQSKYEKAMEKLAKQHYDDHMSGFEDLDIAKVSVEDLEKANEAPVNAGYDLSPLKDCTKESYVNLYIKKGTKEIDKYEYHLECGK